MSDAPAKVPLGTLTKDMAEGLASFLEARCANQGIRFTLVVYAEHETAWSGTGSAADSLVRLGHVVRALEKPAEGTIDKPSEPVTIPQP